MAVSNLSTRGPRVLRTLSLLLGLLVVGSACDAGQDPSSGSPAVAAADASPTFMRQKESRMSMTVGERRFAITLTDNAAARAFAAQLPLTLDMSELNGNEKHADWPRPLPASASRPGTIRNGDLMLYGADKAVRHDERHENESASWVLAAVGLADGTCDPDVLVRPRFRRNARR
jgi:hypothetical protein